jgi:hypothetical protein
MFLFLIAVFLAEIFIVIPWGWNYFWPAARYIWETPIVALKLRDFGFLLFGACVMLGSWCVFNVMAFDGFEEFDKRFPSEPSPLPRTPPVPTGSSR